MPLFIKKNKLILLCYFSIYIFVIVSLINLGTLHDFQGYLDSFSLSSDIFLDRISRPVTFLLNDPLWFLYCILFTNIFHFPPVFSYFITSLIIFSSLLFFYHQISLSPFYISSLILYPPISGFFTIYLRQGLALSLFCSFFLILPRKFVPSILFFCSLIHSSFFIFLFFYLLVLFFNYVSSYHRYILPFLLFLLSFSINIVLNYLSPYFSSISLYLSAIEYINVSTSSFGFLFWIFISIIVIFYSKPLTFDPFKYLLFLNILVYLVFYYTFPMAARFFASSIALLPLIYSDLPGRLQAVVYSSFLIASFYIFALNSTLL